MIVTPKNWREFQHYKDRNPPWIRLHKSLLDNFEFQCLPVASRALAPMLWLIASDSPDGKFDASPKRLAFRLRMSEQDVIDAINPLIHNGFFSVEQDASNVLASCLRDAVPETETETETETEMQPASPSPSSDPPIEKPPGKAAASRLKSLKTYLGECREAGVKPIPDDHYIRRYCSDVGIEPDMLVLAWLRFREEHTAGRRKAKKYIDWPDAFSSSVKDRWYRLWTVNADGPANWTSEGLQARRAEEAKNMEREGQHEPA